ncbi:MAG: alpha-amylase/4-alpha-glucanotransferase domain-containing protein [Burkholderiales bacterium]
MTRAITLLFGVHAHQPVGNFDEVIDDAHRRCYKPFLETLFAYPDFRFSAHFSGWLLDWLRERFPEDMQLLATMVQRGQVELFGSGDTEPVLAAIPHRDRVGQLRTLNNKLAAWTGVMPNGAWLTERVWESSVVPSLAEAGIRYVMVDDYHFLGTGRSAAELDGYFSTEEDGMRLDIFPISEALRYRLPFWPANDVIAYLEEQAERGQAAAIYFDDIEKFGIWPETFDWVYNRGWLKAVIEGVLASPSIRTATYADFHAQEPTRGLVYLPNVSYSEMNEWTLPMPAARVYAQFVATEKDAGRGDLHAPFMRGGIWRNFMSRYPEANWMHKRAQALSARLATIPAPPPELTENLYRAQANDAYWHGLFGGIYLPHLRRAVWNNIVALEAGLDAIHARPPIVAADLDLDGKTEILACTQKLQLALRDDGLGAAHELSSYPLRHNFGDTLRRYHEHYHDKIGEGPSQHDGAGIASAHDRVLFKHPISEADIVPDPEPRAMWLDALDGQRLTDYALADAHQLHFLRTGISKRYSLTDDRVAIDWAFSELAGQAFTTTLNLAMPSCDGVLGRYTLADGSTPCGFGQELNLTDSTLLILDDGLLGGLLQLRASHPVSISCRAHHTVSQSEAGFEKIMQAAVIIIAWTMPDNDCTLRLQLSIEPRPS